MCLWLQIKITKPTPGFRRSITCAREFLKLLPHAHCIWDFLCVFFLLLILGRCIPVGSVCLALLLFCWTMTYEPYWKIKCFLQQVVRDWLKTKASPSCLDHTWAHAARQPAPSIPLSHTRFLPWSCPRAEVGIPQHRTGPAHSINHRDCLCSVPDKCKRKLKWRRNKLSLRFFPKLNENSVRMTITSSPAE